MHALREINFKILFFFGGYFHHNLLENEIISLKIEQKKTKKKILNYVLWVFIMTFHRVLGLLNLVAK